MIHSLLSKLDSKVGFEKASAHCDVPCGIYDPSTALISALTVVRMVDLIEDLESNTADKAGVANKMIRCVAQKEEHAEDVKHEVRIIWGDFLKEAAAQEAHDLTHRIMLKASACRQGVNRDDAVELVELVNEFAELFWKAKGVETTRAVCPYEPKLETVYPVL